MEGLGGGVEFRGGKARILLRGEGAGGRGGVNAFNQLKDKY